MQSDNAFGASRRSFLQGLTIAGLTAPGAGPLFAATAAPGFNPRRWWTQDFRIIQTNLREIDVLQDPREIARSVREFGANAIISSIGGIVAFYPTKLELQGHNRYLRSDFVGEMIAAARAEGLAYIGRFDIGKALKRAYDAHPEWFIVEPDGTPQEYGGTYQACPNGGWARGYGQEIVREALTRYKPDGFFFNMTGFPVADYDGKPNRMCVCQNCQRKFRAMYGAELPKVENFSDPQWINYLEFQVRSAAEVSDQITNLVAKLVPGSPIFMFRGGIQDYKGGIVARSELQRAVHRQPPEWPHQAGELSRIGQARTPGVAFTAASVAFVDFAWRQATEAAAYHKLRMAQLLATGGDLDLYVMGTLAEQADPSVLPPISALFKWHAANAQHYRGLQPAARVAWYHSEATRRLNGATPFQRYAANAPRGAYVALIDSRVPFWAVSGELLSEKPRPLIKEFDVIVAPNVMMMTDVEAKALDAFVNAGGLLIATGMTAGFDGNANPRATIPLASFPLASYDKPVETHGWSLDASKGDLGLAGRIPIDGLYFPGKARAGARNLIPFAPDQPFGPPELSYAPPEAPIRPDPGVLVRAYGKGRVAYIPWLPDWQYYRDGLPVHQQMFAKLIAKYAPPQRYVLTGPGPVELTVQSQPSTGATMIHVVNFAGQRNGRYHEPPAIHGLSLGVAGQVPAQARALVNGVSVQGVRRAGDERTWFDLPPVQTFEALVLQES